MVSVWFVYDLYWITNICLRRKLGSVTVSSRGIEVHVQVTFRYRASLAREVAPDAGALLVLNHNILTNDTTLPCPEPCENLLIILINVDHGPLGLSLDVVVLLVVLALS